MAANKETVCSFQEIVGGHCGFPTKDRSKSVEVLPLLQCKRNIGAHKSALALTGVENEVDLILSRASMFAPPRKVEKLNICPRHRESLGLGWRRPSSKCSIPNVLSSHSAKPRERPKAERGITKWMWEHILRETGILVPVGSGTINYEKKLRVRILTQAWEGRREILIGNRCSQLFSLWKAHGIGPGKKIPLSKINIPANFQIARLSSDQELCDQFSAVKSKKAPTSIPFKSEREDPPPTSLSSESSELYACPEEGCTKSYQKFSALQRHLDCSKHVRALESETMLDKAVRGYASRLDGRFISVPQFGANTISADAPARQSGLQMGWALRPTQTSRASFSDKQKEYLTNKFLIGETTGQKANPVHVARSMMTARDETGKRMFSSAEFLTAKQITSFFSRLAAKRNLSDHLHMPVVSFEEEEEDGEAVNIETAFCELRDHVMANVQPTHPICFHSYNLCHKMSNSKLSSFSITMLKDICEYFLIDTEDITTTRKAPYISRLENFLKQCSCFQR